jgi:hypothetical protein
MPKYRQAYVKWKIQKIVCNCSQCPYGSMFLFHIDGSGALPKGARGFCQHPEMREKIKSNYDRIIMTKLIPDWCPYEDYTSKRDRAAEDTI